MPKFDPAPYLTNERFLAVRAASREFDWLVGASTVSPAGSCVRGEIESVDFVTGEVWVTFAGASKHRVFGFHASELVAA